LSGQGSGRPANTGDRPSTTAFELVVLAFLAGVRKTFLRDVSSVFRAVKIDCGIGAGWGYAL